MWPSRDFSCEFFCNPCEYMRSLSARWESQKSADAESPFLCLTFSCLQHFASRTGTKILAQVVKLPALTLFLPLHYHSHSLFHSSQAKSLRLQPTNVVSQSCSKKTGILNIRHQQTEQNCLHRD